MDNILVHSDEHVGMRVPMKYRDEKAVVRPANLVELIAEVDKIFSEDTVNVDYVHALMESYKSNPADWRAYAKFDPHRYTRNLVSEGNGKYNMMLLCWNEGQGSSIHDHANSHCFMKVLQGSLIETQYYWPAKKGQPMKRKQTTELMLDQCAYIDDTIGLHRVENPSHVDSAITLHLYIPPYSECHCFDENTGKPRTAKVTFWSKYGQRTREAPTESADPDSSKRDADLRNAMAQPAP
uniref:Cysteine dioxygenase n=1 Tax=Macrostomum lignano TaxID=282301 RepID=A0A1I8IHS6_9PLAT